MDSPNRASITVTTETEHLLYKYFQQEKTERLRLESLVTDLKGQIEELQRHLKHIREQNNVAQKQEPSNERPLSAINYETDEEDLARETEWVRQKSRKKRKLNMSLSPHLGVDSSEQTKETPKTKKAPQPPPIVVENIKNYQQFYDLLVKNLTKDSFIVKMMNGETVKINANNEDSYRSITKLLLQNNCLWHSYENKQDRPIRVMAKNLHFSCLPDRIVEDLTLRDYKIQEAVNKLNWRNKEPLNMFILSFHKDEDINKIYNIKSILGCKVDIQPLKTSKLIPQCKRCQAYGHTQKYCAKEPRCVKCTGKHLTKDCDKPAEVKPKCVHCGEAHPANYRGCIVAKELQIIKNKQIKKNTSVPTIQVANGNKTKKPNVTQNVTKTVSYAQITKGAQPHSQQKESKQVSLDMDCNKRSTMASSEPPTPTTLEETDNQPTTGPPKRKPPNFFTRVRMGGQSKRRSIACVLLAIIAVVAAASYDRERLDIAKQILEEVPLIDGHNDLPWNIKKFLRNLINDFELDTDLTVVGPWSKSKYSHTDLPRLREGMVGAQFWSAFVACESQNKDAVQLTLEQIDVIKRLVDKYPQYLKIATSVTDILESHSARPRKIASLIGIEGGHSIANSLGILRSYYKLGVRYMTLTHTCSTPWADSANEPPVVNGLTEFGEKVVKEMNRLGMIVDLSHVSENTSRAAIKASKAPVIFSHSSVYSLCNHKRNVPDDIIQSLKANGGIIMVNFFPDFVKCSPNATLSDVAEHFHYIKRMVGSDYVGIGGDFDGVNRVPRGLEDVSKYPELFAELLRSGQWSVQELKNLAGLNMLRVMRQVEKVRDELRTNGAEPQEHTDSPTDNGNCTSNAFYQEYP